MEPCGAPLPCPLMFCQILQGTVQGNLCVGIWICKWCHFSVVCSLVLGNHEECFNNVCAFKWICISLLLHDFLNFSPSPCVYGTSMEMFLLLLLLLVPLLLLLVGWLSLECGSVLVWCSCSNFCCSMFKVQDGKLQACRATLMWSSSLSKECWLCDTNFGPMCQCVVDTVCSPYEVATVPV